YKLEVTQIPTNMPMRRLELQDIVYRTEEEKFRNAAKEIKELHEKGQPVLVGTVSVEKSEKLSGILKKMGVRHEVLNAKNHEREENKDPDQIPKAEWDAVFLSAKEQTDKEHDEVVAMNGLHILGTERHES